MLNSLKLKRDKLRAAVRSAVLHQCQTILGENIKYQIEGLIGITELDADDVIIVNVLHNCTKEFNPVEEENQKTVTEATDASQPKQPDTMAEPTILNCPDTQSPGPNLSDTLFESPYEFNMKQELGGETLSLSVESFDDSFTDMNMSTSESCGSVSDGTKQTENTEDESEVKVSCDVRDTYDRVLETPEPNETSPDMAAVATCEQERKEGEGSKKPTKMQRYRFKMKHHLPEKYQEQKQRDAERVRNRRRLRQSQMTEEERQRQRERWRDKKRKQRLKRKLIRDSHSENGDQEKQESDKAGNKRPKHKDSVGKTNEKLPEAGVPGISPSLPRKEPGPLVPLQHSPPRLLGVVVSTQAPSWPSMPSAAVSCDQKPVVSNIPTETWRKEPTPCLPMIPPYSGINDLTNQSRPTFSSAPHTQPLFDLTRDDCHVRPQYKMPPPLAGPHRPLSHGPPMSYGVTSGPSYPMFTSPYMGSQNLYNEPPYKSAYIKAEPGLGEQPCCSLTGTTPQINPYLGYKPFNNGSGVHPSWDQNSSLDVPFIKQEPVPAYNNWL